MAQALDLSGVIMIVVHLIDLIKKGYSWPETSLLRAWRYGLAEDGSLQELLLTQELLLSRS